MRNIDEVIIDVQQIFSTGSAEDKEKLLSIFLNLDLTAFEGVACTETHPTILDSLRLFSYEIDKTK